MRRVRWLTLSVVLTAVSPAVATAQAPEQRGSFAEKRLDRICNDQSGAERDSRIGEKIIQRLSLNEQQKNLLKDVGEARAKARSDTKASLCAPRLPLATFKDHEAFWDAYLTARLAALRTARPKADAFYDSLDQTQKTSFDRLVEQWSERRPSGRADDSRSQSGQSADRRDYDRRDYGDREESRGQDSYRSYEPRYSERYRDRDEDHGYDRDRDQRGRDSWRDYRGYDGDRDHYGHDERSRYRDSYRPSDRDDDDE